MDEGWSPASYDLGLHVDPVSSRTLEDGTRLVVHSTPLGQANGPCVPDGLVRVGVANQTTMLATESLAIAAEVGRSLGRRYGEDALDEHFRSFATICSATQERQDAVIEMVQNPPDIMVVIGG